MGIGYWGIGVPCHLGKQHRNPEGLPLTCWGAKAFRWVRRLKCFLSRQKHCPRFFDTSFGFPCPRPRPQRLWASPLHLPSLPRWAGAEGMVAIADDKCRHEDRKRLHLSSAYLWAALKPFCTAQYFNELLGFYNSAIKNQLNEYTNTQNHCLRGFHFKKIDNLLPGIKKGARITPCKHFPFELRLKTN
jgi:hypothetical protein